MLFKTQLIRSESRDFDCCYRFSGQDKIKARKKFPEKISGFFIGYA